MFSQNSLDSAQRGVPVRVIHQQSRLLFHYGSGLYHLWPGRLWQQYSGPALSLALFRCEDYRARFGADGAAERHAATALPIPSYSAASVSHHAAPGRGGRRVRHSHRQYVARGLDEAALIAADDFHRWKGPLDHAQPLAARSPSQEKSAAALHSLFGRHHAGSLCLRRPHL